MVPEAWKPLHPRRVGHLYFQPTWLMVLSCLGKPPSHTELTMFEFVLNGVGEQGHILQRDVFIDGEYGVPLPAQARPIHKIRGMEEPNPDTKGIAEFHRSFTVEDISAERRGQNTKISGTLKRASNKVAEDEMSIALLTLKGHDVLDETEVEYVVDLLGEFSNVLVPPLMTDLQRNFEEGLQDPDYEIYRDNCEAFVETAHEYYPDSPTLGVLPVAGREYSEDLIELYAKYDVEHFCINFRGTRPTVDDRLAVVTPLLRELGRLEMREGTLLYAVNLGKGPTDTEMGVRAADELAAFEMGFDIVGNNYIPFRAPEEVIEEIFGDGSADVFELLDLDQAIYRLVDMDDLGSLWPSESGFDLDRVRSRISNNHNERWRFQKLVSAEIKSFLASDVREQVIQGNDRVITEKPGMSPQAVSAMDSVREAYASGDQSGLDEFN